MQTILDGDRSWLFRQQQFFPDDLIACALEIYSMQPFQPMLDGHIDLWGTVKLHDKINIIKGKVASLPDEEWSFGELTISGDEGNRSGIRLSVNPVMSQCILKQYRLDGSTIDPRILEVVEKHFPRVPRGGGKKGAGSGVSTLRSLAGSDFSGRVFVVHGHDEVMKQKIARTLEKIGLQPIILHEQPSKGRTIVEKFTDFSDVGFAVVLLSPDDFAYTKGADRSEVRTRARQNVILELGYFLGKLGRERVLVIHREASNFELPSDYSGVLLVSFDDRDRWAFELIRELRAAGYTVDANRLLQ